MLHLMVFIQSNFSVRFKSVWHSFLARMPKLHISNCAALENMHRCAMCMRLCVVCVCIKSMAENVVCEWVFSSDNRLPVEKFKSIHHIDGFHCKWQQQQQSHSVCTSVFRISYLQWPIKCEIRQIECQWEKPPIELNFGSGCKLSSI